MKIALGADHGGAAQKTALVAHLKDAGYEVSDYGTMSAEASVDYPDYALAVAHAVAAAQADLGILICGTGIGMAIAANKVSGIRAATVTDVNAAGLARRHNDANVIALSGRFTSLATNLAIVDAFLDARFEGGRHQKRLDIIAAAETSTKPSKRQD